MRLIYLSSSTIPSRSANSIQVMRMCQAFAKGGHQVTLIAQRGKGMERGVDDVFSFYDVENCFELMDLPAPPIKGKHCMYGYGAAKKAKSLQAQLVYGRSLIGCSMAGLMGLPVVYESHAPANCGSLLSSWMFQRLVSAPGFRKLVVITHSLKTHYLDCFASLADRLQVVPNGADPMPLNAKPADLPNQGCRLRVGYVGHLYAGKGIEVVEQLAPRCRWADFHVVGGTDEDIQACRARIPSIDNLFLHGFKSPAEADRYRFAADVLLAPYQQRVAVFGGGGDSGPDIGQWMSPLKVFEYMAAGKAIISSDLPVLREVLTHNVNALLVPSTDIRAWERALLSLRDDLDLRTRLGNTARDEFLLRYTWAQRAARVLEGLPSVFSESKGSSATETSRFLKPVPGRVWP
ncbi:MAG: glycosyltransferase family 4 protein [Phycisphaerae bacterium]|nr:glycosyltransferase family 4 protein [Phycisphaerae bacterium]